MFTILKQPQNTGLKFNFKYQKYVKMQIQYCYIYNNPFNFYGNKKNHITVGSQHLMQTTEIKPHKKLQHQRKKLKERLQR